MENNNTNNNTNNKKKEVGALWQKTSKAGKKFFSGYLVDESGEKTRIVAFDNIYKKNGENSPDIRFYLSEDQDATRDSSYNKSTQKPSDLVPEVKSKNSSPSASIQEEYTQEDIPF